MDIHQNHVVLPGLHRRERERAIINDFYRIAFPQQHRLNDLLVDQIVLCQQDSQRR